MLSQEAIDQLESSPLTSDIGTVADQTLLQRLASVQELPSNLLRVLEEEETSVFIRENAERRLRLSREQTRHIADVLRAILLGERSATSLSHDLRQDAGLTDAQTMQLATALTRKFITPNYFQIAQVYEKRHGKAVGSRQQAIGTPTPPPSPTPASPSAAQPRVAPPRVVDLRNGPIPSRLPPTPREAPDGAKWGTPAPLTPPPAPPRQPSPTPEPPPSPPKKIGPSADDLLDNLGKRPAPPPFVPPPGGGAHGPLP